MLRARSNILEVAGQFILLAYAWGEVGTDTGGGMEASLFCASSASALAVVLPQDLPAP